MGHSEVVARAHFGAKAIKLQVWVRGFRRDRGGTVARGQVRCGTRFRGWWEGIESGVGSAWHRGSGSLGCWKRWNCERGWCLLRLRLLQLRERILAVVGCPLRSRFGRRSEGCNACRVCTGCASGSNHHRRRDAEKSGVLGLRGAGSSSADWVRHTLEVENICRSSEVHAYVALVSDARPAMVYGEPPWRSMMRL